ncbi:MAG: amino acid adenylation domain-containing protein, partial [Gemmatimonadetes bacterium]|nr:amino acid adenylation domain-containing protein [Gemmatimonadota bacterium]
MSDLRRKLSDLSPERRLLLQKLLQEKSPGAAPPAIRRRGGSSPAPLSFAQQRFWLIDRMQPGNPAYNVPVAMRLRGTLDAAALERALGELSRRHEALRTVFRVGDDGEPVQVVRPSGAFRLPTVDLGGLSPEERERVALGLAEAEMWRPLDLERGPLLQPVRVRLDEEDTVLLCTMHHIVSDEVSVEILLREVAALSAAFARGGASPLPEPGLQYADYAVWQREHLTDEVVERQLAYWRGRLAGAPAELPTDHPRPALLDPEAARHAVRLSPEASGALAALARREGATLFMALLAGWQALLARWSGEETQSVGTPVAGRTHPELEGVFGCFVNTLVIRVDLSGDPTAREVLHRVRDATLEAQAHQDVPFERLVEEIQPERGAQRTPFFQSLLALQHRSHGVAAAGPLRVEALPERREPAKFDLKLELRDQGTGIQGSLMYRRDLWEATTVERMVGHFQALLEGMAADPERRLSELELLGEDERARLAEWNATERTYDTEHPVHLRISEQAERTPDALAVRSGDARLNYAELERRATRLARHLRARGVAPDHPVGLLLERGADTVVAVLAILKAGAAYLALDPGLPDERLRFLLDDAGARALVTDAALANRLPDFEGAIVRLDADAATIESECAEPFESGADARSLAYVIYTSGSTGTPKGVLVEHRGLSNYLAFFDEQVLGAEGFALPLVSRLSFDAHVRQLFPPLLRGESVWVLPEATVTDPIALLAALATEERVSFGGVPSLWSAMVEAIRTGEAPKPAGLRAVLLGGEALSPELVARTRELFPDVAIWNHYGPTEATVNTTVARVGAGERVSIGRPIANVRVHLLDRWGQPVPTGVPGELYVGGIGVARGYLGDPARTAAKFLPDPFGGEAGARLYRSGDRVRWRADGELEYVGRVDQQVKVRGFRIEPGEIEAVLERHPGVREAAVVVREDAPGEARLVGYVVAEAVEGASAGELRAYLGERLPEYMVPAVLVELDALPLSPNGKVDRRALPAPEAESERYEAPRTQTEELLAGIWAEVLRVERVGVHDDFFALGGHSLLAMRVATRVREALGVEVPVRVLFESPVLAELAERVDALLQAGSGVRPPPIERVPRDRPLPLSFAQQRMWFIQQLEPESAAYNLPFPLRIRGPLDVAVLERALSELQRRQESLRTVFVALAGEPTQVVLPPRPVAIPRVDLRALPAGEREAEARRLAAAEVLRPFDLERAPLRTVLFHLDRDDWGVVFTLHHIVSDGWSMGVLANELSELYTAIESGRDPVLPDLPVQYPDFAVWQRGWLRGEALERLLGYWKRRLDGARATLDLPTDRPR